MSGLCPHVQAKTYDVNKKLIAYYVKPLGGNDYQIGVRLVGHPRTSLANPTVLAGEVSVGVTIAQESGNTVTLEVEVIELKTPAPAEAATVAIAFSSTFQLKPESVLPKIVASDGVSRVTQDQSPGVNNAHWGS